MSHWLEHRTSRMSEDAHWAQLTQVCILFWACTRTSKIWTTIVDFIFHHIFSSLLGISKGNFHFLSHMYGVQYWRILCFHALKQLFFAVQWHPKSVPMGAGVFWAAVLLLQMLAGAQEQFSECSIQWNKEAEPGWKESQCEHTAARASLMKNWVLGEILCFWVVLFCQGCCLAKSMGH